MRLMASVLISKSDSQTRNAGTKKAPFLGLCGVPGATRTPGLSLRRRSLYPTELREHGLWGVAQGECTSSTLGGGRSILLSYGRILSLECLPRPRKSNTVGFLRRRPLYPAELRRHVQFSYHHRFRLGGKTPLCWHECGQVESETKAESI